MGLTLRTPPNGAPLGFMKLMDAWSLLGAAVEYRYPLITYWVLRLCRGCSRRV